MLQRHRCSKLENLCTFFHNSYRLNDKTDHATSMYSQSLVGRYRLERSLSYKAETKE